MPFKAYLPSGFEHDHENVSFDSLVRALNNHFGQDPAPHFLIGNVMFDGEELDAVFLKRNAISVIEMKNYGGMLRFSESTEWFADDKMVYGGRHLNPFLQVRTYKFALKGCLQRLQRDILSPQRSIAWSQISGVVLFCKSIRFNEQEAHRVPDQIGWWFHVTDLNGIANKLASLEHQSLRLTDLELQKLLALRAYDAWLIAAIDGLQTRINIGAEIDSRILHSLTIWCIPSMSAARAISIAEALQASPRYFAPVTRVKERQSFPIAVQRGAVGRNRRPIVSPNMYPRANKGARSSRESVAAL